MALSKKSLIEFRGYVASLTLREIKEIFFGSSGIPGGYLTRRLINAPSNAFPRFRTL